MSVESRGALAAAPDASSLVTLGAAWRVLPKKRLRAYRESLTNEFDDHDLTFSEDVELAILVELLVYRWRGLFLSPAVQRLRTTVQEEEHRWLAVIAAAKQLECELAALENGIVLAGSRYARHALMNEVQRLMAKGHDVDVARARDSVAELVEDGERLPCVVAELRAKLEALIEVAVVRRRRRGRRANLRQTRLVHATMDVVERAGGALTSGDNDSLACVLRVILAAGDEIDRTRPKSRLRLKRHLEKWLRGRPLERTCHFGDLASVYLKSRR